MQRCGTCWSTASSLKLHIETRVEPVYALVNKAATE